VESKKIKGKRKRKRSNNSLSDEELEKQMNKKDFSCKEGNVDEFVKNNSGKILSNLKKYLD
jgi:hypothetical protein